MVFSRSSVVHGMKDKECLRKQTFPPNELHQFIPLSHSVFVCFLMFSAERDFTDFILKAIHCFDSFFLFNADIFHVRTGHWSPINILFMSFVFLWIIHLFNMIFKIYMCFDYNPSFPTRIASIFPVCHLSLNFLLNHLSYRNFNTSASLLPYGF